MSRLIRKTNSWVAYTQADGLADDAVNAVAVDDNLVWFATNEGVSRYDVQTNTWQTFKRKDGLASERVSCIAVDGNYVWFGTDSGLNRYDKSIDSWAVRSKKDGLISNNIRAISVEPEYVWVGTAEDKRDRDRRRYRDIREKKSMGGVSRYQRSTDSWNNYSKADGLIGEWITTMAVGEDMVWFGTYKSGVSSYSKTDQTFVGSYTKTDLLVSDKIRSIMVDGNSVWFGTANGGVQRYIKSVNTWVRYTQKDGLADDHVTWINVSGNEVWFGTYQNGVSKFDKASGKWTIYAKADQLADEDVRVIAADETGNLWIGTAEGLSKYAPDNQKWLNYNKKNGLASNYIAAVAINNGQIWIGTDRGLGKLLDNGQWQFYAPRSGIPQGGNGNDGLSTEFVTALAFADQAMYDPQTKIPNSGVLWAGTSDGIFLFNLANRQWESFADKDGLPTELITTLAVDDNYIWAGTHNGLWRYNPQTHKAISYNTGDGLGHNVVNTILVTPRCDDTSTPSANDIWVGTQGGLSRYNAKKDSWTTLTREDGSTLRNVCALAWDEARESLWIGTPGGLASFDVKTNKLTSFASDPLREPKCDYNIKDLVFRDDTLWLGTTTGLVKFSTAERTRQEYHAQRQLEPLRERGMSNIEFDGDYIWFSNWDNSPNGCILQYNRRTDTWRRFNRVDILLSPKAESMTQIRWIHVEGDYVWFATDLGVLRYQKPSDTWRHYTIADGLNSNDLREINSSKRSVWVSEAGGGVVNRFDKQAEMWSTVTFPCEFIFDSVSSIAVDGDDVWFGTRSGLHKLNELTDERRTYTKKDGLAGDGVEWICADDKYIWVARSGWGSYTPKGLSRYDKASGKWRTYSTTDVLMDDDVSKIIASDNHVWLIYESWRDAGVSLYNKKLDDWTDIKPKGDWGSAVTEISEDGDYIWLATEGNGLKRYHLASGTWTSFDERTGLLHNHVTERALKVDDKYVWVGTPRGLNRYDKQTESWTYYTKMKTLTGREVKTVAADERYVWCGTDEGLSRYDKWYGTWKNFRKRGGRQFMRTSRGSMSWWEPEMEESLANNNVSALAVDKQYVWVGTRDGANRYDKIADRWDKYTPENGLPHPDITSVAIAGNNVWMGTNAGIGKYPRTADDPNAWVSYTSGTEIQPMVVSKEFAQTLISDEVWCISASKKAVWVGTRRGVSRYDPGKDLWTTFTEEDGLASNEVSSIALDGDSVWFGGDKGVTLYDEVTHDWIHFTIQDGLVSNRITCIAVNGEDIWFGAFDAGVMHYNKANKTWRAFSKKDGLAHDGVLSIAADRDSIWVGTHRGLSRYNKHTNTWTTYTENYGPEDI